MNLNGNTINEQVNQQHEHPSCAMTVQSVGIGAQGDDHGNHEFLESHYFMKCYAREKTKSTGGKWGMEHSRPNNS